jgi:glucosyl-3-phosphoglycerate synthase
MPSYGRAKGKGDALWRSLSVVQGDLVMYADSDTRDFEPQFIYGVLGPILQVQGVRFVKAAYRRPFKHYETVEADDGGRVTELMQKPLFNLFYPELTGFVQPLAGEYVAPRNLFCAIPFMTGYAVETGIMIDVLRAVGLRAMAQVNLDTRQNRHQPLFDLSRMSYAVLRAVAWRLHREGRLLMDTDTDVPGFSLRLSEYIHAVDMPGGLHLQKHIEDLVERPPMVEILRAG